MLKILSLFLFLIPAFANNGQQVSVLLDAGVSTLSVLNTGNVGGMIGMSVSPGSFVRLGVTFTTIPVPPASGTTYAPCVSPCTASVNRQWGQQYYFIERLDINGDPFSPRQISTAGFAYNTNACGSAGTLPMIEPAVTTTSPLPMPREVIGQDCFVDRARLTLQSPHASTGIRLFIRIHSPSYNVLAPGRYDGKAEVQINSGAWQVLNEADSNLTPADEARYLVQADNPLTPNTGSFPKVGGSVMVRDYTLAIPNGTIGSGDTTVNIGWRFRGTEGFTSGFRILEMVLIESTDCDVTNLAKTGTATVGTCSSHGWSSGDDILIRGAPGERMVFNGMRHLSAVTSNTFTFANCDYSSGGSKLTSCVLADGNWAPPVNRDPNTNTATQQAHTYASRMLVARSAFTYTDPSTWTAPVGGDPVRGQKLFQTGNGSGTTGQHDQLVIGNMPYLNYTFHNAVCASCHSPSGADIKYYGFSNESIIQRSIIHGYAYQDGLDMAAYIRGNAIAVPTQARPWNPPFQTGPGMASGTFTKAATTLTSVVVSSNVGTFTVPGGHGYTTGQPVTTSGATVDTDLNATCTITVTSSTAFTCSTVSVANGTYTESTLQITMANDFAAGCGVDCQTTYGYDDMLSSISDTTKWVYSANIEPRTITWPYQFPDWDRYYLPAVFPGDVYPSADFLNSPQYLAYLSNLSSVTPGSFASYKSNNYTLDAPPPDGNSLFRLAQLWMGNDAEANNLFSQTYPAGQAVTAGAVYPSQWNLFRQSVTQQASIASWTLMVEYKLLGLYGQMMADINGTPTATDCNPPWGHPGKWLFYMGPHVEKMFPGTTTQGWQSDHELLSNAWYTLTPAIGSGACYDTAGTQIDTSYLEKFFALLGVRRANGYVSVIMEQILSPQAGRNQTNLDFYAGRTGLDWGGLLRRNDFDYHRSPSYQWFTSSAWSTVVDKHLANIVAFINPAYHDATYWRTTIDNIASVLGVSSTNCSFAGGSSTSQAAYLAYLPGGTENPCNFLASYLTYWTLYGANSTNITTVKTFAATLWPSHNFQLDIDAATEGDTGDYGSGNLTATGSHVITFSTKCPTVTHGLLIAGGGALSEIPAITANACTPGSTGTITVTTTIAHPNGWKATGGCSTASLYPNYDLGLSSEWFRCKNMYP